MVQKKLLFLFAFMGIWMFSSAQSVDDYPWLEEVLNSENCCTNQSITIFPFDHYSFVYVTANESCPNTNDILYFDDGRTWCTGDHCLSVYNLDPSNGIKIYNCDAVAEYDIFDEYTWLNMVVNQSNCCSNKDIQVIDLGLYSFIYISGDAACSDGLGRLYYETGELHCSDASNFNCLFAYGFLDNYDSVWSCTGGDTDVSTDDTDDTDDTHSFLADGTNLIVTIVPCMLSDGTETDCYEIVTNSTPTDHQMGPWCPDNISDDASAGGIWLEGGEVFDVDGAFIENMATFYNDDTWMMYDANGDIFVTDTEEDCINAANPNVGDAYQNFCVECLPSYIANISQTWLIPVTPVLQTDFAFFNTGPGGGNTIPSTRGIALNGVEFSAPAPVNNILSAYTLAPFDDAGGHINVNQGYHYHAATGVSAAVAQSDGHAPLIGYALDGHGIYAQVDTNENESDDLDECRGHTDAVRGYHYHVDAAGNNNFINCLAGAYVVDSDDGGPGGGGPGGGGPGGGGPGGGGPGGGGPGGGGPGGGGPGRGGGGAPGEIINAGSVDITSVVQANFRNNFTEGVSVQVNENSISISSTGLPDHRTPYWGEGHEMFEPFPGRNRANANMTMISHNYVMTIPMFPGEASDKEETTLGAVGMALNGVPIYNDLEGGGVLQENAWGTFDAAGAHPGPGEDYHYHVEGTYLSVDDFNLIGFLRDGFPVYGRRDMDGSYPNDLDENGGHIGMTPDFPEPIYHYHVSSEVYSTSGLYVIKSGAYHGTKGTFTQ